MNPALFLKLIYGKSISGHVNPADFSFKELRLLKKASRLDAFSLRKIVHSMDEPDMFIYTNAPAIAPGINASGKSFFSEKEALLRAVGETVERLNWVTYKPAVAAVGPALNFGGDAMDIFSIAGFSAEQRKTNKDMYFTKDTSFRWIEVDDLIYGGKKLAPAQLFSPLMFNDIVARRRQEPVLRYPITTGSAAGWSRDEIIYRGILESIERDAFMITYLNKITPRKINLSSTELCIRGLPTESYFRSYDLEAHAVLLESDFPVYSVMSFIIDRSGHGPALSVGMCSSFSMLSAIHDSFAEAASVRLFSKSFRLHEARVDAPPHAFKARDRKVYWSKIENLGRIEFMLKGEEKSIHELSVGEGAAERTKMRRLDARLHFLLSLLKRRGYGCFFADTTSQALQLGLSSGVILIPELHPMHLDERFPCLGSARMEEALLPYGHSASAVNAVPHPFH